jgi:predicted Zn-dependent peptidase
MGSPWQDSFSMSEVVHRLPSGLTVAVEPMSSTRTASIGVWIGVGARDEPESIAGVSHFLEHLLFKGTERRSAIDISQAVDRVGGDINAYTAKEYTTYYCRVPARVADLGIDLLADVLTRPALRDADVESERHVILDELAMDDDSPEDVVHRVFAEQVFGGHPLGRETAGERASVTAITADDVREFFRRHYRAGNAVVAVAGAVDPDHVIERVADLFAAMPVGDGRAARHAPGNTGRSVEVDDDTEQVHLVVGGRSIARTDPDREALDVVNHVLGGGLSSRLFDEIRERRGLAYSVFSSAAAYADTGMWSVYAGTLPEHATEVHELVGSEIRRLVDDGITADELEIATGYLTGSYEMGLEDSGARMSRLGGQLTLLGRLRSVEEQLDRWSAVTLDDTRRVIERVYADPPLAVTLGPRRGRRRGGRVRSGA